jgi:hypothetical protein
VNKFRFALILGLCCSLRGLAAATITTELSADETSVGMPVQMQINVEGTTNVVMPPSLGVSGLESRLTGRQTLVQINNGRMTTSGVYVYTIIPQRAGTFEIPPIEINADGQRQQTTAKKLLVQAGTAPAPRPAPAMPIPPGGAVTQGDSSSPPPDSDQAASVEIIVPKKSIYAGEVVPVEIRFYLKGMARFRPLQEEPLVSGEGFTVQKLSPATQTREASGDSDYLVLAYKTSIAAVKSGELPLPSVEFHGVLSMPAKAPANMQSIFDQFFGGQGMSDDQEVAIKSEPKTIRVKALPVAGRPEDFSGAVGDFTIAASADPTTVPAGDPVTLKIAIAGRGNFDAMGEPDLIYTDGWKTYPPTSRFEKTDGIGYAGTKTFEMPMVALQPQTHTPIAQFSYFDPDKEKYFVLKSQPVAIHAAADPAAPAAAAPDASSTPKATPAPNHDGEWLTHSTPRSWQPLAKRPVFWIVNAVLAIGLIGAMAGIKIRRSRLGPAGRRAARVRERDRLLGELGQSGVADEAFYARALDALTIQAELTGESGPFELVRSLEARGRNISDLHAVLARADEMKFSGGSAAATPLDAEERRRIIRVMLEVCR